MKKTMLFIVPLCLMLSSCPLVHSPPDQDYGSLFLTLSSSGMAKTILPPLDMDIEYYDISGDGPDPATFYQPGVTGSTVGEDSLISGAWTITADAFNSEGYLIGTGSTDVSIIAGQTTEAEILVTPLEGTGVLNIDITWPENTIVDPILSGTLTAVGGGTSQDIPFNLGTDSASYSFPSLDVGYYSLDLEIADGAVHKWGAAPDVRILKDQTTQVTFNLTAEDLDTGGVDLTIVPDMEDPITITFAGQALEIPSGADMTITATTSNDPIDTYLWYLNGAILTGETSSSITIGSDLAERKYRLDLRVTKGNVGSSESIAFTVIESPEEILSTNVAETGTQLDIYFYKGPQFDVYPNPLYAIWVEDTNGEFMQNLYVCNGPGTNEYPMSHTWAARPSAVPYWAHKCCIEDPYVGDPEHDTTGMYLALPTGAGGPLPEYPVGPIPLDLDAVTSATRLVDFQLQTARKDDGATQFRLLLEIQKAWDYNDYYTQAAYNLPGQPSLIYGVDIDMESDQKFYTMELLGSGHPFGDTGELYDTSEVTTALEILGKAIVHVRN